MRPRGSTSLALGGSLALVAALIVSSVALAGGRPFTVAPLSGSAEAPNPGDPDGTGTASFWLNAGTGTVCWSYSVSGVEPLVAAHIHHAPVGVAGPVVIPMLPTSSLSGSGCTTVDRSLVLDIIRHPSAYYFNVHNATYPSGALRGQLSRTP